MTVVEELTSAKRLALEAVQADSEGDRPEDALKLYAACTRAISKVTDRRDIALSEEVARELHHTLRQYAERSEQLKLRLVREGRAFGLLDGLLIDCCGNTIAIPKSSEIKRGVTQQTKGHPNETPNTLSFTLVTAYELDSLKPPSQRCYENEPQENSLPEDTPLPMPTAICHKPTCQYDSCALQSNANTNKEVTGCCSSENSPEVLVDTLKCFLLER